VKNCHPDLVAKIIFHLPEADKRTLRSMPEFATEVAWNAEDSKRLLADAEMLVSTDEDLKKCARLVDSTCVLSKKLVKKWTRCEPERLARGTEAIALKICDRAKAIDSNCVVKIVRDEESDDEESDDEENEAVSYTRFIQCQFGNFVVLWEFESSSSCHAATLRDFSITQSIMEKWNKGDQPLFVARRCLEWDTCGLGWRKEDCIVQDVQDVDSSNVKKVLAMCVAARLGHFCRIKALRKTARQDCDDTILHNVIQAFSHSTRLCNEDIEKCEYGEPLSKYVSELIYIS